MACENCTNHDELRSVTRLHNRALRRVNKRLRHQVDSLRETSDEIFMALCETNVEAEQAFRELWESGGFQPPIGPQDYQTIVELCLDALKYKESHASRTPAQAEK